jgi:hypothetical protein
MLMPEWPSGYGGGLLIHFPYGFPGSNPGSGVLTDSNALKTASQSWWLQH